MSYYITSKGYKIDIDSSKTQLYLSNKDIVELDLTKNINLEILSCYSNKLTQLDLSNNINLKKLFCTNTQLTELNTSKCIKLKYLYCDIKTNINNINQYINNENIEINQI